MIYLKLGKRHKYFLEYFFFLPPPPPDHFIGSTDITQIAIFAV